MMRALIMAAMAVFAFSAVPAFSADSEPRKSRMEHYQAGQCLFSPREIVTNFVQLFYVERRVRDAFETYVDPGYIQHDLVIASGRDAAIEFLEPIFNDNPGWTSDVKRILADGNMVVVHVHNKTGPNDPGVAVVDILRVQNCKIVEHWDVLQDVPENPQNDNTMF